MLCAPLTVSTCLLIHQLAGPLLECVGWLRGHYCAYCGFCTASRARRAMHPRASQPPPPPSGAGCTAAAPRRTWRCRTSRRGCAWCWPSCWPRWGRFPCAALHQSCIQSWERRGQVGGKVVAGGGVCGKSRSGPAAPGGLRSHRSRQPFQLALWQLLRLMALCMLRSPPAADALGAGSQRLPAGARLRRVRHAVLRCAALCCAVLQYYGCRGAAMWHRPSGRYTHAIPPARRASAMLP